MSTASLVRVCGTCGVLLDPKDYCPACRLGATLCREHASRTRSPHARFCSISCRERYRREIRRREKQAR